MVSSFAVAKVEAGRDPRSALHEAPLRALNPPRPWAKPGEIEALDLVALARCERERAIVEIMGEVGADASTSAIHERSDDGSGLLRRHRADEQRHDGKACKHHLQEGQLDSSACSGMGSIVDVDEACLYEGLDRVEIHAYLAERCGECLRRRRRDEL